MYRILLSRTGSLVLAAVLSLAGVQAYAQPPLFLAAPTVNVSPAQTQRLQHLQSQPTTGTYQLFNANLDALKGDTVNIPLVDGTVTVQHTKTQEHSASYYSWFGKLPDGNVNLVVQNGEITGSIRAGLALYRVSPLGGGLHAIIKVDQSQFKPELPPLKIRFNNVTIPDTPLVNTTYDVLVAYTPAAAADAGNIEALIQLAVDETNTAYSNSQIAVTVNLVGVMPVPYTETTLCNSPQGAFGCALIDVTDGNGVMSAVHTKRDQVGADEVVLLINNNASCGLAWLYSNANYAYAVVANNCATGNYSFGHEIGHNFGADHDADNATNSPVGFPDNRGYINSGNWRTVMAYSQPCICPRVQSFSNPNVIYPGPPSGPMGVNGVSNNARVHNVRAATIAGFRQAPSPGVRPPTNLRISP
jgi:hypothetical protein